MSVSETKPYFGKIIILLLLSVGFFLGFKAVLPGQLFPEQNKGNDNQENVIMDNLLVEAISTDSTEVKDNDNQEGEGNLTVVDLTVEDGEAELINDPTLTQEGYKNLNRFYAKLQKLEKTKKGKIRIAYFGDSMNDGDFIVQDVRREFQEVYGGQGVGFVAITSLSAGARYSVAHQHSKNWKTQAFINVKKPQGSFGVSGQVFFGNDASASYWVRYKAQGAKFLTKLYNPTLFYGKSNNAKGYITIENEEGESITKELSPTKILNTIRLATGDPKSLKITFSHIDSIPIYGVSFDDGQGVHIDNFSLRGNSGLPLSMLNVNLMNAFNRELEYDLIVLQYGANVLSQKVKSYGWYEKGMTKALQNLRICFPNADILIISTADKATKIEGVMQTDPATTLLLNAQKKYARNNNAGFINLYNLMGGNGSMIQWVGNNMAAKDYTHFSASGSKKIAKFIYNEINEGYILYKKSSNTDYNIQEQSVGNNEERTTSKTDSTMNMIFE